MSQDKINMDENIFTFSSYGEDFFFFLPDRNDHIQRIIRREKQFYEQSMLDDIYSRIAPGTVAIDVGAHIGNHTVFFSKLCKLKVIALEPFLYSYRMLNRNIELNGQESRVKALRKAAGSYPGRGEPIVFDPLNTGENCIWKRSVGQVEIIRLDDLIIEGHVSLIKVDVEGMEIEVLEGAKDLIKRYQPLLYIEAKEQILYRDLRAFLAQFGYRAILQFNWTPTFLFMPCNDPLQRYDIIMERIERVHDEFEKKIENIQGQTNNLEQQDKETVKRIENMGVRFERELTGIGEKITRTAKNNALAIEDKLSGLEKNIKHNVSELEGRIFARLEQQQNKINEYLVASQVHQDESRNSVFFDNLKLSWNGWRKHQKVNLGQEGRVEILQDRSTPGVRKENIPVDSNSFYRFAVRGSFQVKNSMAFFRVMDPDSDMQLCPLEFFSGNGDILERHVTFRTLHNTLRVNVDILVMEPCEGDTLILHSAELRRSSVPDAYPSTADSLGEEIIASMASIPQREEMLRDTISSLYPAVSKIRVFLNNYDHIPEFLMQEKIEVARSQDYGDNGDAGKFFWVDNDTDGYRLICDDDLVYPPDYIDHMIRKLRQYDNSVILGAHGILLKQPLVDYYNPNFRYVQQFSFECTRDQNVHILGTGCVAYHSSVISLDRKDFMFKNMADIWLALKAQKERVPMLCIEHPKHWLIRNRILGDDVSIYTNSSSQNGSPLDTSIVQNQVIRKNLPFTIQVPSVTYPEKKKIVLGITTYNRRDYLQACIESFLNTRSTEYEWVVIVADDGSTDDTLEYLENLVIPHEIHIIKNKRRYACGQTNTIFELCQNISFDIGFKVDDDLVFMKKGWDDLYIEAMERSGFQHLCYMNFFHYKELRLKDNPKFAFQSKHIDSSGLCEAVSDVLKCMGCFFTFTPKVLKEVGWADEKNFPIRGQWHIDFSSRCCRAGFNEWLNFYDAKNSNEYLDVQNNIIDDYRCAIPWGEEYAKTKEPEELARRQRVMDDESRVYISPPEKIIKPRPTNINEFFDRIYVLNLDRRPDRWEKIKAQADKHGINIHRFPAVDGMQEPHRSEWERYFKQDLVSQPKGIRKINGSFEYYLDYDSEIARVAFLEKRNHKKAIQSPGAWGYIKTMIMMLEEAINKDFDSILVLDDDAVFHKNINALFEKYIKEIPDEWKILQLGTLQYHWGEKWITWVTENVYKCNGCSVASHAVGIHHSAFPLLLNYCCRFDLPYDEGPLHVAKRIFRDQSFTFYPNMIIQNTVESDIKSSNVQQEEGQKRDNVYGWRLEDYDFKGENAECEFSFENLKISDYGQCVLKYAKPESRVRVLHFRETFSAPSETFIYDMVINLERYTETDNYVLTLQGLLQDERPFPKTISLQRKSIKNLCEQDYRKVAEVLRDINPDLIIAHFGLSAEVLHHAMHLAGLDYPMVVSMHGYDLYEEPLRRIEYAQIIKETIAKPNVIVTYPSDYVGGKLSEYLDIPAWKTRKVNNIGNDVFYMNRKSHFWKKGESIQILNVARMVPWKGHRYLLEGFALFINDVYPNSTLTLVGCQDFNKSELIQIARDLGISEKIDFRGYVSNEKLIDLFRTADVFVQPSFVSEKDRMTESFGVVLLEAIYVGLPVVATDAGGMPEVIGNAPKTAAKIIEQKSGKAIANALGELYYNGGIGSDNHDYALERRNVFSLERQMNSLIQAMADVCPRAAKINFSISN